MNQKLYHIALNDAAEKYSHAFTGENKFRSKIRQLDFKNGAYYGFKKALEILSSNQFDQGLTKEGVIKWMNGIYK